MLFRARELREGATPDDLRRQMNEAFKAIERDLVEALAKGKVSSLITDSTYSAGFGEVARFAPPSTGTRLILPEPNLAQLDARITAVQEAATGPLSVEVINGTINGATTLTFLAGIGTVEFVLTPTGWYAWSATLFTVPLTSLAAQAAETFLINATAVSAPPTAVAGSTVAGAGLTYTTGGILAVGGSTSVTVNANDVQRAALTGDVTAPANSNATTIAANAVTNAKLAQMAARTVKLRADGAGTGDPIDGTGAQLGEIYRAGTRIADSTSTGTVAVYAVTSATNVISFLTGIGAVTLRGMTAAGETGQVVYLENNDTSGANVTLVHEFAAASTDFRCPGSVNLVITPGHRVVLAYVNQRWRVFGSA